MSMYEINGSNGAPIAEVAGNADALFELGMSYATGRSVPFDLVSAHKWFNLAALRGNKEAIRLRREIAEQMSEVEIAEAQKAARNWLTTH
jgi:uncharacterized protein